MGFCFTMFVLLISQPLRADEIISNPLGEKKPLTPILLPADRSCNSRGCYKIIKNQVFEEGKQEKPLGALKDAKEMIVHNNYLWTLGLNGDLWIWTPVSACWIHIESAVEKIRSDHKTFFIIKKNGDLLTFSKGDVIFTRVEDAHTVECMVVRGFLAPSAQVLVKDVISDNSETLLVHQNNLKTNFYKNYRAPASDYYDIFAPAKEYLGAIPKSE